MPEVLNKNGTVVNQSLRKTQQEQAIEEARNATYRLDGGGILPNTFTGGVATPPPDPTSNTQTVNVTEQQKRLEDISTGQQGLSSATKADVVKVDTEQGVTAPEDIQQITTGPDVTAGKVTTDTGFEVTQGTTTQVSEAAQVAAAKVNPATVNTVPVVQAAASEVSKLVDAAQTGGAPEIQGATISPDEIKEGYANNVEGALSSGAFADAAKGEAAQIDTGGLPSLEDIDLSSPEVQAQVAELPEEALVSTQMNKLLEGMEKGQTPAWALPALDAVNQQLAARGMSVSTVGRNALFSAIVQSALPIAQQNAQALKERAAQNLGNRQQAAMLEAQLSQQGAIAQYQTTAEFMALNAKLAQEMGVANLNNEQATAIYNASQQATMDLTKFNAAQQVELANSKWMQTASLQNLSNDQQAIIQEATLKASMDMANADRATQASIENARNFLQMDMANLSNEQQAIVLNQQAEIQKLFSNQAAENAAKQFNAASDNQINTFMANLSTNVKIQNAQQLNAMEQFNATQANMEAAQEANNAVQVASLNAQLETQINEFNAQREFQVDQWNAANAQAIEQSNIVWRRNANTADTAAENAINQQNALNAFNLEKSALDAIWQQMRDDATFDHQNWTNYQTQVTNLYATALSHEGYASRNNWSTAETLVRVFGDMFDGD